MYNRKRLNSSFNLNYVLELRYESVNRKKISHLDSKSVAPLRLQKIDGRSFWFTAI